MHNSSKIEKNVIIPIIRYNFDLFMKKTKLSNQKRCYFFEFNDAFRVSKSGIIMFFKIIPQKMTIYLNLIFIILIFNK